MSQILNFLDLHNEIKREDEVITMANSNKRKNKIQQEANLLCNDNYMEEIMKRLDKHEEIMKQLDKHEEIMKQLDKHEEMLKGIKKPYKVVFYIVSLIFGAYITYRVNDFFDGQKQMQQDLVVINEKIDNLEGSYYAIDSKVWQLGVSSNTKVEMDNFYQILPKDNIIITLENTYDPDNQPSKDVEYCVTIDKGQVVATSIDNEIQYKVEDLINENIIFTYNENGEQVIFCGKYNENKMWDGKCLINRYKDGKLTFITEAEYDDGILLNYRQVFKDKDRKDRDRWYVANWNVEGELNRGETISYFCYGDYDKDINLLDIKESDVMDVNTFCLTIPSTKAGYYNGYMSKGNFNDNTGQAYLIEFNPEGYVTYLYMGNIVDSKEEDHTGNAWFIALGYDETNYYLYEGNMTDGKRDDSPNPWYPLSREEIYTIINGKIKEWEALKWYNIDKLLT